ncbi:MAG: sphingosine N-acyltransferase lag1 [Vezdaea aestivalis]|nr:MAG: sphingosine N-acyltransferase lag1 [Vezdaea aestivalis]
MDSSVAQYYSASPLAERDRKTQLKEGADFTKRPARALQYQKKKRKDESLIAVLKEWIVDHQIGISINLLVLLFLVHTTLPRARPHTRKFFELSYRNPETGYYRQGPDDFYLIAYWTVIFMGLRAATMDYILAPFAQRGGVDKVKGRVRFAEQGWLFLYCTVFWTTGMYIMYHSDYWLNFTNLWQGWPHTQISSLLKWYYLVQLAFWVQQIIVVNIEERRKDYHQMLVHHIFTCALILGSYGYYHLKTGNLILCLMDVVDILLPLAKMLKYLQYEIACNITFGVFMLTWMASRHGIYIMVCWSLYKDWPRLVPYQCFSSVTGQQSSDVSKQNHLFENIMQAIIDPKGTVCFNRAIRLSFLGVLLALQVITLMWYWMIVRVAWKILKGQNADDSRSDDEDEDEGAEEGEKYVEEARKPLMMAEGEKFMRIPTPPLEEEVGVEEIDFKGRAASARKARKGQASASGVTLPGHSDKKELLGRIGCDKTT